MIRRVGAIYNGAAVGIRLLAFGLKVALDGARASSGLSIVRAEIPYIEGDFCGHLHSPGGELILSARFLSRLDTD